MITEEYLKDNFLTAYFIDQKKEHRNTNNN